MDVGSIDPKTTEICLQHHPQAELLLDILSQDDTEDNDKENDPLVSFMSDSIATSTPLMSSTANQTFLKGMMMFHRSENEVFVKNNFQF